MPIEMIQLPSGLALRDAVGMLREKFRQWPWANYDGDPPGDWNRVDPGSDVDRVYRLGSRTPRRAYVGLIGARGNEIASLLEGLPREAVLEDVDLQTLRDSIVGLFDVVMGAKHIGLAGATKLLYPFRPRLLPVIDSVLENYYWYATSIRDERRFRGLESIDGQGDYVFSLLELIKEDVHAVRQEIDDVLAACRDEAFAGASRVRVLESLIWQYYARSGATLADVPE